MKRTIAALALALAIGMATAAAQSSIVSQIAGDKVATESLYFSLKFGLNFSYLKGTTQTGRTGGFNIGISATIKLTERLSLVPEITPFIRKGVSKIPFELTGDPKLDIYFVDLTASELALSYIDIPVLVTYRLGRFHLGAGPFVSFLTDATERFRTELPTGQELSLKSEVTDRYKSMDGGLVAEASWTITKPRRGMGLVFHVRCQQGLTSVLRKYSGPLAVLPPRPERNSVIEAYLSFPFVH